LACQRQQKRLLLLLLQPLHALLHALYQPHPSTKPLYPFLYPGEFALGQRFPFETLKVSVMSVGWVYLSWVR
jgi:hypothetical protein